MSYAAGILYRYGNAVLLLLRGDGGDHPNTWGLPGGKVEAGETPLQAARREAFEEIRHEPPAGDLTLIDQTPHFTTYAAEVERPFVPAINDEHKAFAWAPLDALPAPLHPGLAETLARMQSSYAEDRASARQYDGNGWFEVKGNPLSKVGIFPYSGRQLGIEGPEADRIFRVYRPAEELGHPDCIDSFKLIPWVDNHTMIGPNAVDTIPNALPAEAKGVHGVVGEDVYFDNGVLYGNIKAFSNSLAELIAAGKRELSAGYRCVYDMVSGVWNGQPYDCIQRNIRGNHLALVSQGRMGPDVAVMDRFTFTFDAKEIAIMDKTEGKDAGSGAGEMTLSQLAAVVAEIAPQVAKLTQAMSAMAGGGAKPAEPEMDEAGKPKATDTGAPGASGEGGEGTPAGATATPDAKDYAAMDAALKATRAQVEQLQALADPKAVLRTLAQRDALVRRLEPHVGAFDHAEMTVSDVAAYGCDKLGIKVDKASALPALEGYLTAAPKRTPSAVAQDAAQSRSSVVDAYLNGPAKA